jgi:4-hydroxy-4-methyl-2-oxoglutarate aldolase
MKHRVVRNIARVETETIQRLGKCGVATVHEAQGRRGLMAPYMRPIYPAARMAGSAVTVSSQPGDNLMIHAAVEVCKPGDVLVVTTTSESNDGMFGELLGVSCAAHGVVGLTEMNFPVWAKAVSAQGTVKSTAGSVNIPVVSAGAMVNPGDVIVADADGVVVVPRELAAEIAKLGEARIAKEEQSRARLRNGELGVDFYGLRARLKELGVEYVD